MYRCNFCATLFSEPYIFEDTYTFDGDNRLYTERTPQCPCCGSDDFDEAPASVDILDLIPQGRENAISRKDLADALGTTDRIMRRRIEQARDEGALILNLGGGYYQSNDLSEIEHQYRVDKARALSILKRCKTMRRVLKEAGKAV